MGGFAWVTMVTNDSYSLGALVLAHSLKRAGTKHDLAVLITPGVTGAMREKLSSVFTLVQEVNVLDSRDESNLALLARPELGITFTKLHCWRLTQYEKCVFVDADTLVIRNCDELFEREELSAAPDVGWPDCFNSGVFVFKPSQQTFASLTAFAASKGSFDGGDQGLLNLYFSDWAHKDISKHLPFIYNMCSTATYSYLPAYKQFGEEVRIIHFIGSTKPWLQYFDTQTGIVHPSPDSNHVQSLLQHWWNIFCRDVHSQLSPAMAGIAGALSKITLGEARSPEQVAFEEHMRKQSWEEGQIDYMGRDSFDNIWKKICSTVFIVPETEKPKPKEKVEEEVKEKSKASPSVATKTPETENTPAKEIKQGVASEYHLRISPEENKNANDLTEKDIREKSSNVVLSIISAPPQLCIKESGEEVSKKELTSTPETSKQEEKPTIPSGFTRASDDPTCKDESTESKLDTSLKESCARTIPESPVPIQVAESVLEADIKESVSEDIKPVTEEAISSISAPIQESISTVVQAPLEPSPPAQSPSVEDSPIMQPNGNALDFDLRTINNIPTRSSAPVSTPALTPVPTSVPTPVPTPVPTSVPTPVSVPTPISTPLSSTGFSSQSVPIPTAELTPAVSASKEISKTELEEEKKVKETESIQVGTSSSHETEAAVKSDSCQLTSKTISESKSDTTLKTTEDNVPEEVPKTSEEVKPESKIKPVVSRDKTELLSEAKETEPTVPERVEEIITGKEETVAASKDEQVAESSKVSEKSQPKELIIPGTPTVIEATPPTSPPLDVTASLSEAIKVEKPEKEKAEKSEKKVVKKIIKKSSEEKSEGGETDDGKKVTKKVVKKVVKKIKDPSDDTAESGSSTTGDKPKKVIKVVKKTTKSVQSLDPDTSVPDTPPPATSQMPVPPKRKLKPATTKSSKKTEQEPPTKS
ncbi:cell surface glycoprotein 1 isoform X3 [Microplitis demolitor]|uniref:cell surface glycoprotein 1 isoform X3 n=1 Tax=Microplitis demolitor TaxID=69319 RepID=UPI0004CCD80F|nr:cell surface glycoprotein 1 isoform X3 [Microplitis demolitor]